MISNETLYHKDPATGKPQMISLGWMDDSMTPNGPTEEDPNYIADTGFTPDEMAAQVSAYRETIGQFNSATWAAGGFTCAFNAHHAAPARCARTCDPDDPITQPCARPTTLNQQG
jgi:hypothetical protein